MREIARQLYWLLSERDRRRLALLAAVMVLTALTEVVGVASIMPFMTLVARPDVVDGSGILGKVYAALGFESKGIFLLAVGTLSLLALVCANGFSALASWMLYKFSYLFGHALASRLLGSYLAQPYSFFLGQNSASLAKNILSEVERITIGLVVPALQMAGKAVVAAVLVLLLIVVDPLLALIVASVSAGAYTMVYRAVRRRLNSSGSESSAARDECFRYASEALSGIKEIKLGGSEREFVARFAAPSLRGARAAIVGQAITGLPRYALEAIAFGSILLITLYLLATHRNVNEVIPTIALYAFAGYRVMPALQQIYHGATAIRFHTPALRLVHGHLHGEITNAPAADTGVLSLAREIEFDQVEFVYASRPGAVLRGVTLRIAANTTVAITGPSGAGKTTLIDILLGLLAPTSGLLRIDGVPLTSGAVRRWQRGIGYVPQQIFISDDTLAANVAFGIPRARIDRGAVERAARLARLHEFASSLPDGYDTRVGERGMQLSGGQRQRLGIARALYADPPVLVLDEATSALDGLTESAIMDAIHGLAHRKTIVVIAHRLSTVQACDVVHMLDRGKIVCSGTYAELIANSEDFRALARTPELA